MIKNLSTSSKYHFYKNNKNEYDLRRKIHKYVVIVCLDDMRVIYYFINFKCFEVK